MGPEKEHGFRAGTPAGNARTDRRSILLRAINAVARRTAVPIVLLVGWLGLILAVSSRSPDELPSAAPGGLPVDVVGHLVLYGVLGVFTAWSVRRMVPKWGWSVACVPVAGAFAFLWGSFDEWYQSFFPGRDSSWGDVGLDTIGGFAGGVLLFSLQRLFRTLWLLKR